MIRSRHLWWTGIFFSLTIAFSFITVRAESQPSGESSSTQPSSRPKKLIIPKYVYYYDEETGEESVQSINDIPPLLNKNGKPTLVRAANVGCTACGKDVRWTAYLEKFTPEAKSALEKIRVDAQKGLPVPEDMSIYMRGFLVRSPEKGSKWVLAESEAGREVTSARMECPKKHDTEFLQLMLPSNDQPENKKQQ